MNIKFISRIVGLLFIFLLCMIVYKFAYKYLNRPAKIIQAPKVVVTLPEGLTNEQMAEIIASKLPLFNKEEFLKDSKNVQGYLFPDTYFFTNKTTTLEVSLALNNNFKKKIETLDIYIQQSGKKLSDIIVMASILEEEANGIDDIEIISGILWKRISIGIPLQVDAAPITYQEKGLPIKPISNPGLVAIKAAIKPKLSNYLYYLHDKNGKVYYAHTYAEHKRNINNYLR